MYHEISALESGDLETDDDSAMRFDMTELYKWLERPLTDEEDDSAA